MALYAALQAGAKSAAPKGMGAAASVARQPGPVTVQGAAAMGLDPSHYQQAINAGLLGSDPGNAVQLPPPGTYDPSLDYDLQSAGRQYGYNLDDWGYDAQGNPTGRLAQQAQTTEKLSEDQVNTRFGNSLSDLLLHRARAGQDFQTQRQNLQNSQQRQQSDTNRNFQRLGVSQQERINAFGALEGGALAASNAARAQNQGLALQRIHEAFDPRFAALQTSQDRFGADSQTAEGRLQAAQGVALGELKRRYGTDVQGHVTDLQRQGTELGQYAIGNLAQRLNQAQGQWSPTATAAARKPSITRLPRR